MIEDGNAPWSSPNSELVALWSEAAVSIAAIDPELATRLRQKAEYWSDPEQWNDSRIEQTGISIDKVAADARELLQIAVPRPPAPKDSSQGKDFFISHASEDKEEIALPPAAALEQRRHTVWLDKHALRLW